MKRWRRTLRSYLITTCGGFLPVISGCGAVEPQPLAPTSPVGFSVVALPAAPAPVFEGWKKKDEERLGRAIQATFEIVRSELFQKKLAALDGLYDGPKKEPVSSHDLLSLYLEKRLPAHYARDGGDHAAHTGTSASYATVNLGAGHAERWADGDSRPELLRKACAVNTIAHEWTHTVPGSYDGFRFVDGDHKRSVHPLVSYTVGSVAHCAFLEDRGLLGDENFWACVEAVGTNVFNGGSVCEHEGGLHDLLTKTP